jgi:rRNA maturation protein Nop10
MTKGKIHPRTGHGGPDGEKRYSCTLSLTSVLDGGRWSTPRPGHFTPWNTRYPSYRRLGGPQGWCGKMRKISTPSGFDPRTVQPLASRYTDWAISAPNIKVVRLSSFRTSRLYSQQIPLELISVRGWVNQRGQSATERRKSMKIPIENRTRNLPPYSAVP